VTWCGAGRVLVQFEFHAAPAATGLLQALDLLRDLNVSGKRTLPEHVPTGFVKPRWRPYVFTTDGLDRHFYELCALAELRDSPPRWRYLGDRQSPVPGFRDVPDSRRDL
jgi:hypothetical protein